MVNLNILKKRKKQNEDEYASIIEQFGSYEDLSKKRYLLIQKYNSKTDQTGTIKMFHRAKYLKQWLNKYEEPDTNNNEEQPVNKIIPDQPTDSNILEDSRICNENNMEICRLPKKNCVNCLRSNTKSKNNICFTKQLVCNCPIYCF